MKKIISFAIIAVMILSVFALTSCGKKKVDLSDSKYVGTWKTVKKSEKDVEWTLILKGDGTGSLSNGGKPGGVNWDLTPGGFQIEGGTKMRFWDDGDNVKATVTGVEFIFEKQ